MFLPKQLSILVFSFFNNSNQLGRVYNFTWKQTNQKQYKFHIYIYIYIYIYITELFISYFYNELVNFIYDTKLYKKKVSTGQHSNMNNYGLPRVSNQNSINGGSDSKVSLYLEHD